MQVDDVDFTKLQVRQPKRCDTFMSGKVSYNDSKFVVKLNNVRITSCKRANDTLYVQIKLPRHIERFFMDLEEYVVNHTVDHVDEWFKSKMNPETVDEYFVSGLSLSKKHKLLLKLRIDSPSCDITYDMINKHVDLALRVTSVRFLKTSFWLCYDIVSCEDSVLFVDEDDDNRSLLGVDEEADAGPDCEVLEGMRKHYMKKLEYVIATYEEQLPRLKHLYEILERNNFSMATFDAVENALCEIICQV